MTQPTRRTLSLTPDHLARVAREVPEPAQYRYPDLTEAEWTELIDSKTAELGQQPFWIFAYGSLIWNPAFDHIEARRGVAHGWRRSFCLHLTSWRGTNEEPGLMLALDRGGSCTGMLYRLPDTDTRGHMRRLLEREIGHAVDVPWLRWLDVRSQAGIVRALTFYCAPREGDPDLRRLDLQTQARMLARACGHKGSCAEYLFNTVDHLEALGIHDSYLWKMQKMVAAEIDGHAPPTA